MVVARLPVAFLAIAFMFFTFAVALPFEPCLTLLAAIDVSFRWRFAMTVSSRAR